MNEKLKVLITGGGSGIGAALAKELSADGHSVVICGRREENLAEISGTNENICYHVCDVSDEESVLGLRDFVKDKFVHIDVIINNAGLFGAIGRFDRTDSQMWKKTFEINLFGTYFISKHFLDMLLLSNVKKIINFSGGGAFGDFPNYSAYATSKAAVVRFSECLAVELADTGVKVNCIAPGFVATEIHNATLKTGKDNAGDHFNKTKEMLKEGALPMEIVVNSLKFLISKESDGLTGKTISASFDKWDSEEFKQSIGKINESELYTMRRINLINLDEKDELRKKLINL